ARRRRDRPPRPKGARARPPARALRRGAPDPSGEAYGFSERASPADSLALDRTAPTGERGLRSAPCCLAGDALDGRFVLCARARRRPARARFGLRLSVEAHFNRWKRANVSAAAEDGGLRRREPASGHAAGLRARDDRAA